MKYVPKVFLVFKLPDVTQKGFFRQSQRLGDIIASFGVKGEPRIKIGRKMAKLNSNFTLTELGLKNDDIVEIK